MRPGKCGSFWSFAPETRCTQWEEAGTWKPWYCRPFARALIGALIARGWPHGRDEDAHTAAREAPPDAADDAFADDLAALLAYTGEKEDKDETTI